MVSRPVKKKRPRWTLVEVVKRNLIVNNIYKDLVFNQVQWHCVIHVTNLTC